MLEFVLHENELSVLTNKVFELLPNANGASIVILDKRVDDIEDRVLVLESNDRVYLKLYQAAECDIRQLVTQVTTK